MTNQQLLDFIRQQLQLGLTKEKISSDLLSNGWSPQDIKEGFSAVIIPVSVTPATPSTLVPPSLNNINPSVISSPIQIKKHSGKKIFFIVLILFLLAGGGSSAYYYKDKLINLPIIKKFFLSKVTTVVGAPIANTNQVQNLPTDNSTNSNTANTTNSYSNIINFIPQQKIASFTLESQYTDSQGATPEIAYSPTQYTFYKVGQFIGGIYKGGSILLALVQETQTDPCKGSGCNPPLEYRYADINNTLTLLTQISEPDEGYQPAEDKNITKNLFNSTQTIAKDDNFDIPILEYPQILKTSFGAQLKFQAEEFGIYDSAKVQVAFNDPIYGDVYTTKPQVSPQKSFYGNCPLSNASVGGVSPNQLPMGGCGIDPLLSNDFFFFRPDGTYLVYSYTPSVVSSYGFSTDLDNSNISWSDGVNTQDYDDFTAVNACSNGGADAVAVLNPDSISLNDLKVVGKDNLTNDLLYVPKDPNNILYKEFYSDYVVAYPKWYASNTGSSSNPVSYTAFLNARPIVLWYDPFARLIRFTNQEFLPPQACEPLIYLYPSHTEKVNVSLDSKVTITNSYPVYNNGWQVEASPSGELTNSADGKSLPYLFWEGYSSILPMQEKGFVVKSSEVKSFLNSTLPELGLNQKETDDFISAWAPKLNQAPYYFLTFIDQSIIDKLAPLNITPTPDTTIRVLMDFKPLATYVNVLPLVLPPRPSRNGFSVVEWGALVR